MIRIGSKYGIRADVECWQFGVIGTRTNKETGEMEEFIVNPRYPKSLDDALRRYAEREVLDADPQSWADVLTALNVANAELRRVADAMEAVA